MAPFSECEYFESSVQRKKLIPAHFENLSMTVMLKHRYSTGLMYTLLLSLYCANTHLRELDLDLSHLYTEHLYRFIGGAHLGLIYVLKYNNNINIVIQKQV